MKRKIIPFIALTALMLIGCKTQGQDSSGTASTPAASTPTQDTTTAKTTTPAPTTTPTPVSSPTESSPAESSPEESSSPEVVQPDFSLDMSSFQASADGKTKSDGHFTLYVKDASKDGLDNETAPTQVKISGNSEFKTSGPVKAIKFVTTKAGKICLEWKSGTKGETMRVGYIIKANENGLIEKTVGRNIMTVSDEGQHEANWDSSEFNLPEAGTYYIACNAAISVRKAEVYYDSSITAVTPISEVGTDADVLNPTLSLPTSDSGYAAEKAFGSYTMGEGVQSKFYGKIATATIDGDSTRIPYSCFEFQDGETMKFYSSGVGTLTLLLTGRGAKDADGNYPTSSFICKKGEAEVTASGDKNKEMVSSSKTKAFYTTTFSVTAGDYTFTSTNVTDVYYATFSAVE